MKNSKTAKLHQYPIAVFPAWMADMIKEVSKVMQTPQALAANFGLSAVSACLAQHIYVKVTDSFICPSNIWTLTMMPSGGGKSPVCKMMTEALAKGSLSSLLLDDISTVKYCEKMQENQGKGVVLSPEGTVFESLKRAPELATYLLKSYNGEAFQYDRHGRFIKVDNPLLTIGVAVQNDIFAELIHGKSMQHHLDSGLLARFLPTVLQLQRQHFTAETMDVEPRVKGWYNASLKKMQTLSKRIEFKCTEQVLKAWLDFKNKRAADIVEDGRYVHIAGWMSKMDDLIFRLSGILAVMDRVQYAIDKDQEKIKALCRITPEIFNRAKTLAEFYRDEMLGLVESLSLDKTALAADKLREYFTRKAFHSITVREVKSAMRWTNGLKTGKEVDAALQILVEEGILQVVEKQTSGGKSQVIYWNPKKLKLA